jgi:20S proteasome subunit alpha 6
LIKHGLLALRETLATGDTLSTKNVAVGIVGKNQKFTILENATIAPYISFTEKSHN